MYKINKGRLIKNPVSTNVNEAKAVIAVKRDWVRRVWI